MLAFCLVVIDWAGKGIQKWIRRLFRFANNARNHCPDGSLTLAMPILVASYAAKVISFTFVQYASKWALARIAVMAGKNAKNNFGGLNRVLLLPYMGRKKLWRMAKPFPTTLYRGPNDHVCSFVHCGETGKKVFWRMNRSFPTTLYGGQRNVS